MMMVLQQFDKYIERLNKLNRKKLLNKTFENKNFKNKIIYFIFKYRLIVSKKVSIIHIETQD